MADVSKLRSCIAREREIRELSPELYSHSEVEHARRETDEIVDQIAAERHELMRRALTISERLTKQLEGEMPDAG